MLGIAICDLSAGGAKNRPLWGSSRTQKISQYQCMYQWYYTIGLGFRVQGLGFRVQGLGFRVQGSMFYAYDYQLVDQQLKQKHFQKNIYHLTVWLPTLLLSPITVLACIMGYFARKKCQGLRTFSALVQEKTKRERDKDTKRLRDLENKRLRG